MELNELEELREYNELDLLYKLIDIAKSNIKRAEQSIKGNKTAGIDVRQSMQDIRLLAEFIRESVQINKLSRNPSVGEYKGEVIPLTKLEKTIVNKKESLKKEEVLIDRTKNLRIMNRKSKVK
jgi:hypothetical protein